MVRRYSKALCWMDHYPAGTMLLETTGWTLVQLKSQLLETASWTLVQLRFASQP